MPQFTPNQQAAINLRQGSVLVSAAAGSGKTAVLTRRVVDILCDTQNPVTPDKILVVTFTNAAAAEMRQRIFAGLSDRLALDPQNHFLRSQQALLPFAEICTIDSFCMRLVRENAALLGIRRDFSIGDSARISVLEDKALSNILEARYEAEDSAFLQLADSFGSGKNDNALRETIKRLYRFFMSIPSKEQWISHVLAQFDEADDFFETSWGAVLKEEVLSYLQWAKGAYSEVLQEINFADNFEKIVAVLNTDLSGFDTLIRAANESYTAFYTALHSFAFERFPAVRALKDDVQKDRAKVLRDRVRETVQNSWKIKTFVRDQREHQDDCRVLHPLFVCLYELAKDYCSELERAKQEANHFDFCDIEYYAMQLLCQVDGLNFVPSPLAQKLQGEYAYILVDEYQDTNALQDTLFSCLSSQNLFMVGDVKQSIYKFRQANPDIFIHKSNTFVPFDGVTFPALMLLEKNFRSSRDVTEFVNFIFGSVMSSRCGDIEYDSRHALVNGGTVDGLDTKLTETEIVLVNDTESELDETHVDARTVASAISKMIGDGFMVKDGPDMRPVEYSDFAVLLRQKGDTAQIYVDTLNEAGIPAQGMGSGGFMTRKEIMAVLNYLRFLVNPTDDTALTGTLLSPLFSFTADELAKLKSKGKSMYICLQESTDFKVQNFLQISEHLRHISFAVSAKDLIERIYTATDIKNKVLFLSDGKNRVANLHRLLQLAEDFSGAGTLRSFVSYVDSVKTAGEDFDPAPALQRENCVRVMTIHGSKGLEFPVVFVAGLHKKFNTADSVGNTLLSNKLGFSCVRRYQNKMQHTTLIHKAVSADIARQQKSEELRVLYVALTRAKQKLILPMVSKRLDKELTNCQSAGCSPTAVFECQNFKSVLLSALCDLSSFENLLHQMHLLPLWKTKADFAVSVTLLDKAPEISAAQEQKTVQHQADEMLVKEFQNAFFGSYSYEMLTHVPAKMAAGALYRDDKVQFVSRPAFMTAAGLSPTERGNAMHKFMQFCSFELAKADPQAEILRMQQQKYLSAKECEAIRPNAVSAFFEGDVGKLISRAQKVHREYKFFTFAVAEGEGFSVADRPDMDNDDKVLVQGIADCVLDMGDKIIIIDYKTDVIDRVEVLTERYYHQMKVYAAALGTQFGKPVDKCVLYSFHLSKSVEFLPK